MDYYEELGIERAATKEDISQAHRRLTKLLHPDQQTDGAIKVLADKQMRRLNSIVEVLMDPERRLRYDQHLQFISAATSPNQNENVFRPILMPSDRFSWLPSKKTFALCISSAVAGGIMMMCGLLLWTNDWGSNNYDDRRPGSVSAPTQASATPSPALREGAAPAPSTTATSVPFTPGNPPDAGKQTTATPMNAPSTIAGTHAQSQEAEPTQSGRNTAPALRVPGNLSGEEAKRLSSALPVPAGTAPTAALSSNHPVQDANARAAAAAPATSKMSPGAPASPLSSPNPVSSPTSSPGGTSNAGLAAASLPQRPRKSLEGDWIYAPAKREASDPGYYVPQFIHLKLSSKGNGIEGAYEARYMGVPKSISPDVAFSLSASNQQSQRFVWQSSSGSRGTFRVSLLNPDKLRIDWRTTVSSPQQGLTSGVATLIRHNP